MRENGYYWVRCGDEWHIAEWISDDPSTGYGCESHWYETNVELAYDDYQYDEIGEKVERKENRVTLRNTPRLGGKVSVVLLDTETGKEETLMIGAIVGLEATEDGAKKITVRRNDTVS